MCDSQLFVYLTFQFFKGFKKALAFSLAVSGLFLMASSVCGFGPFLQDLRKAGACATTS